MDPVEMYIAWLEAMAPEMKEAYAFMVGALVPGVTLDHVAAAVSFVSDVRKLADSAMHTAGLAMFLAVLTDEILRKRGAAEGPSEALRRSKEMIEIARSVGYPSLADQVAGKIDQVPLEAKREQKIADDWAALRETDLSFEGIDGWLKDTMRRRRR